MKDKEKQINEMAKDLEKVEKEAYSRLVKETQAYVKEHHRYNSREDYSLAHTKTVFEITAEEMTKLGWVKLPEDSVVLSREEYEILTKDIEHPTDEVLKKLVVGKNILTEKAIEKASKETAEKILFKFESAFAYYDNEDMFSKKAIFECLEEIVKSCGVEIKE